MKPESFESESIPPFMKGFVVFLLLLIPLLGYFILRSDPVIYSNNVEKNVTAVKRVRTFAAFIEKKPELAMARPPIVRVVVPSSTPDLGDLKADLKADARERVRELSDIWRQQPPQYDEIWRDQVEKLFDLAEKSGSEDALDLIRSQILAARGGSDDRNRQKADEWLERYLKIEKRPDRVREMTDFYREKVNERIDQDERKMREDQNSGNAEGEPLPSPSGP